MQHDSNQFAICINNQECDDLELLKIYRILPDDTAAQEDYLRVIDESGEDYLYPQSYFLVITVSPLQEKSLLPLFTQS
jgi:hypothetical protein